MATLDQRVRPEILRIATPSGGLDLVDLVLERITSLDELEALTFRAAVGSDAGEGALALRLADAQLFEGPDSDELRQSAWAGRKVRRPRPIEGLFEPVAGDWDAASALPDLFAEAWREPERWRRLAEDHAGGQRYLTLPGLVRRDVALRILAEVRALSMTRLETELVRADRHLLGKDDVPTWLDLLGGEVFRGLVGSVLGRPMPPGLVVNAWRLGRGDMMGVHPDGRGYFGTVSLGLAEAWSACDGGAIAFGLPRPSGFEVRQRWFPHLGDVCLFAPDGDTWHAVEAVRTKKVRLSLTGWWVSPENGLTRGAS
ncbi:MAG: 2OG-Fe(II) oxygenase family protein [Myxococcota bacterium]